MSSAFCPRLTDGMIRIGNARLQAGMTPRNERMIDELNVDEFYIGPASIIHFCRKLLDYFWYVLLKPCSPT